MGHHLTNATQLRYYDFMKDTILVRKTRALLENANKPLTAQEIIVELQKAHLSPHKTTIYRLLERLQQEQKVQSVQLDEKSTRYEKKASHHHHIVCERCNRVEDLIIKNEKQILNKLLDQRQDFIPLHHQLEVFGICGACAK